MTDRPTPLCTAFAGHRILCSGPRETVALAVRAHLDRGGDGPVQVFEDATGRIIDFDLRGGPAEIVARLAEPSPAFTAPPAEGTPRGRGRPRLGVVAREVTLLPRHWDWLAAQPGGASVALRRLVEAARKEDGPGQTLRAARDACYRVMSAVGGDLPGFEEAARALFAGDRARFDLSTAAWPPDLRDHAARLGFPAGD
ncbi:MAG: DUF2239 family protein [Telmatospirillum sp.]|nr:DUF2239 family protein [Telmatospirillum sp.]